MKIRLSGLFAAILGFTLTIASDARSSTIQTIQSNACQVYKNGTDVYCGFAGGTWLSAGSTTAYVDGISSAAKGILLDLVRYSYTGTRTESIANNLIGVGGYDSALATPQMAANPSEWDYYFFYVSGWPNAIQLFGSDYVIGVSLVAP
jgi:hypothetical protein